MTNFINANIIDFVSHFMDLNSLMWIKTKIHEHLKCWIEHRVHRHICKHWHKHIHRAIHHIQHAYHNRLHAWELVLIVGMLFFSFMFAWSTGLPNNSTFDYPLKKVSTLECRTLYRDDMPDNCKIDLPIIHWANYDKYQDSAWYKDIYTTMFWASYSDNRNWAVWAHDGTDIATARWTPLYSIWNWKVYFAWWKNGYGNVIKIKYLYKWEYIYVVYAHMDTIEIEQWATVSRWQRIWTVWNSGNTFGALWWYHVHFQIEKDAWWWPKYAFLNCPDLSKWTYEIIQKWFCREQLLANDYDPIKFIEWNYAMPLLVENKPPADNKTINNVVPANTTTNIATWQVVVNDITKPVNGTSDVVNIPNNVVADKEIKRENLTLDISNLDEYSQHFWSQNEIWIESDLVWRSLKLWEEWLITININKKNPTEKYNWILTIPFNLISTNTNIWLNLTSIKLVSDGKVEIKVKWNNVWLSSVLISFGWKKIWKISLSVGN